MADEPALLAAEKASFGYVTPVLRDITLAIRRGERVAIVGANGAGKSTLLRGLLGLLRPMTGQVLIAGVPARDLQRDAVARRIAYLPQEIRPAAGLSALDVVLLGRAAHRAAGPAAWVFDSVEDQAAARAALAEIGVETLGDRSFRTLSGGERKLVLLAQALAQAGEGILLDEPTAALDLRAQVAVAEKLRAVAEARKLAVVVVTHDLALAARICDRLILLADGRVAADGPPDTVLDPALLRSAFGVDLTVLRPAGVSGPVIVPGKIDRP